MSGPIAPRIAAIYIGLIGLNLGAWTWAAMAFPHQPLMLGTALLAYSLGLRHAVDADHIAAIDNVTRKLMQEGQRPTGVGLFFSLGHSTVVVLACVALAFAGSLLHRQLDALHRIGATFGTIVSASFLLAVAAMNLVILATICRTFWRVKEGRPYREETLDEALAGGGLLVRLLRPLFGLIRRSWHMYPLGFLFGLGFDTATEIGLLGISATQASQGTSIWSILIYPALFTAGMSLVDTTDSILMLGAYGWAFIKPIRKLYYNMTMTFLSVVIAVAVGGMEVLGLAVDKLELKGRVWESIGALTRDAGTIGFGIIGLFIASWLVSALIYHLRGYDSLEVAVSGDGRAKP
jgi:high-affinity nickel-transport protein